MPISGNFEEDDRDFFDDEEFHEGEEDGETVFIPMKEPATKGIKSPFVTQQEVYKMGKYDIGVDYGFFVANVIGVVKYQPWQLGLFHKQIVGKFIWYPRAGTLLYEKEIGKQVRIGKRGDFLGSDETSTERVYKEIIKTLNK